MFTPVGKGRHILSKEARAWKKAKSLELMGQRGIGPEPCYWRADILIPGKGARCDLTNYEKALTDILVETEKAPDDRYLVDFRIRFHGGDFVVIAIKREELNKWATIKHASKSLIRKLSRE